MSHTYIFIQMSYRYLIHKQLYQTYHHSLVKKADPTSLKPELHTDTFKSARNYTNSDIQHIRTEYKLDTHLQLQKVFKSNERPYKKHTQKH